MSVTMDYPQWLEKWWMNEACSRMRTPNPATCLERLRPAVQELSDRFTRQRDQATRPYIHRDELQLAYALFFNPQTFTRLRFPLRELLQRHGWTPSSETIRILDLGAGLGASGLSVALAFQALFGTPWIAVDACDQIGSGLSMLSRCVRENRAHLSKIRLTTYTGNLLDPRFWKNLPRQSYDWIITSFALNEILHEVEDEAALKWMGHVIRHLAPGGRWLITEPALTPTATRIQSLRDLLIQNQQATVLGPCLHQHPCPLLREGRFTCHDVRRWSAPDGLRFLNRKLFRELAVLKFSYLALTHPQLVPANPLPPLEGRLVTPLSQLKGKWIFRICGQDGQLHTIECLKRHFTANQTARWRETERGAIVRLKNLQTLGDATLRLEHPDDLEILTP